jgi:hypothetical protein
MGLGGGIVVSNFLTDDFWDRSACMAIAVCECIALPAFLQRTLRVYARPTINGQISRTQATESQIGGYFRMAPLCPSTFSKSIIYAVF